MVAESTFASGVGESVGGKDAEAGDAQASSMQADAASDDRSQHDAERTFGNRSNPAIRGADRLHVVQGRLVAQLEETAAYRAYVQAADAWRLVDLGPAAR